MYGVALKHETTCCMPKRTRTGQDLAPNSTGKFGQRFGTFLSSANNNLLARGHAIYAFCKACIVPTFTVACTRTECKASASVHHDAYKVRRTLDHSTVLDDRTFGTDWQHLRILMLICSYQSYSEPLSLPAVPAMGPLGSASLLRTARAPGVRLAGAASIIKEDLENCNN